jgi:hypothetical protein
MSSRSLAISWQKRWLRLKNSHVGMWTLYFWNGQCRLNSDINCFRQIIRILTRQKRLQATRVKNISAKHCIYTLIVIYVNSQQGSAFNALRFRVLYWYLNDVINLITLNCITGSQETGSRNVLNMLSYKKMLIDWLINWCLTATIFQLRVYIGATNNA